VSKEAIAALIAVVLFVVGLAAFLGVIALLASLHWALAVVVAIVAMIAFGNWAVKRT
jgi:hypothetical protein